jgi:hypothetical protein
MPERRKKREPAARFISPQPNDFWKSVGIYPQALAEQGNLDKCERDTRQAIERLGIGNLRLLCEEGLLPHPDDVYARGLADMLLRASDRKTLMHLAEFLKRRSEWVERVFGSVFTQRERTALDATLGQLCGRGGTEKLKPFTKLLLLYRKGPAWIEEVFFQDLWINRTTYFEFGAKDGAWPGGVADTLVNCTEDLAKLIGRKTRRGVVFAGTRRVTGDVQVMLFVREYAPKVARDFREEYNIHYRCGVVVVAVDERNRTVQLKCASMLIAEDFQGFLEQRTGTEFVTLKNESCDAYNPEQVRNRLLGIERTDGSVGLADIRFARSGLLGGSAITVEASVLQSSITEGLHVLADQDIVDFRGPADLEFMTFLYKGKRARVRTEVVPGGAMRMTFENAGWAPEEQTEMQDAVYACYGLPINKLVDPGLAGLGYAGVYSHLLRIRMESQVEGYQRACYEELLDVGILRKSPQTVHVCGNGACQMRHEHILVPTQDICRMCEQPLREAEVDLIERDEAAIAGFVRDVFDRATGWMLADTTSKFEGRPYYALVSPGTDSEDDRVCVLVADRLLSDTRHNFERFSRPVILVQGTTDSRQVYVDDDGVGHVSLAYLLAAQADDADRQKADDLCEGMLTKLRQTYELRVLKAAEHAKEVLRGDTLGLSGNQYEREIFNVLRAIFPYTHKLGREGKKEPDGFVSVPFYGEHTEYADAEEWTWTYDAKHSDDAKGYDLNIDERRKIVEYINSFRANRKVLDGSKRKIKAHVIITNNLGEEKRLATASHVFGPEGIKQRNKDIRLVFVHQGFLLRLVEWAQSHTQDLRGKRPYFNDLFIRLLEQEGADKYTSLDADDANALIAELADYPTTEPHVDGRALEASLDSVARPPARVAKATAVQGNGNHNGRAKGVPARKS